MYCILNATIYDTVYEFKIILLAYYTTLKQARPYTVDPPAIAA